MSCPDPVETSITMLCLMYDWSAEVRNASTGMSASLGAESQAHSTQHEQHAVELIQRVRVCGANYVEEVPAPRQGRASAARRDWAHVGGIARWGGESRDVHGDAGDGRNANARSVCGAGGYSTMTAMSPAPTHTAVPTETRQPKSTDYSRLGIRRKIPEGHPPFHIHTFRDGPCNPALRN